MNAISGFDRDMSPLLQRASDFLAIPVTLSIVLMIADSLLIWAALSQHRILLWPWLVLYAIEFVVLVALLVYFMVVMPKTYLKVGLVFSAFCGWANMRKGELTGDS